ncbi:hypothetical protein [Lacinutrix sp. Bg11-31]|uniref:hypothetical protein n=1 Tax=Lacinutrix sp. Bg11-31 TaxID=2057808 RepID=UPI000C319F7D|nr:hypothetical protein [Lacinutrix sp. Bg11-31]AUC80808.1 hypothetical protein CW733_01115 [Lacinutrix sp. Bg11-31]
MKNLKVLTLLSFALLSSLFTYGQQQALTNIQKNINKDAAGLEQLLNFTLDTLTLKSDKNILRVTFLSHDEKDSIIIDVDAPEIKIPLYHLKKGRYTIAVYREDKIIALGVKRVEDIPRPKNAIDDLEESILRSSLSEEEQIARNIKPLKKKPQVTKEEDTRVAVVKSREKKADTRVEVVKSRKKKKDTRVAVVEPSEKKEDARDVKSREKKEVDTAVAVAKPRVAKEEIIAKIPARTRKEKETRVVSNVNKKNVFEIAAEREEAKRIARLKNEKDNPVAEVVQKSPEKQPTTLIEVKKVTYNLSQPDNDKTIEKQTREDYRANNLRPNGTRYEN